MGFDNLKVLEMLSLIYEDLDIDTVERRFVELTSEIFNFDRTALFFVKHKKALLKGKLSKGFDPDEIESLEIPLSEEYILTSPLITGLPVWNENIISDSYVHILELKNFAVIPIINKKRIPCWQINDCREQHCPAYGNKWVRCWLVSNTSCSTGKDLTAEEKLKKCEDCPVFHDQSAHCVEGILLVDNSLSMRPITDEVVMVLSMIGHTVGVAIDNSKRFEKTMRIAIKDDLTGLHNRRYFNERLLDELERVNRYPDEPVSLLMVDIDFFKKINDRYGHQKGDTVLVWFGNLLQKKLRKSDIVARYGGEEFAILLINTSKAEALEVGEDLRRAIEKLSPENIGGEKITASFGIATFNEDAYSFKTLLAKADLALYAAKAHGRNRVSAAPATGPDCETLSS